MSDSDISLFRVMPRIAVAVSGVVAVRLRMQDSDEFERLLSQICENARQKLCQDLSIIHETEKAHSSTYYAPHIPNDIEIGTIVSLIAVPQAPDFLGLGIVLAIQNNVFR